MRLIIAGSRSLTDDALIDQAVAGLNQAQPLLVDHWPFDEIVSGTANGIDQVGERFAARAGLRIKQMPADWNGGKSAGFIRNALMAEYADALVAIWDGQSKGTANMLMEMQARHKPWFMLTVRGGGAARHCTAEYDEAGWGKLARSRLIANMNNGERYEVRVDRESPWGNPFHANQGFGYGKSAASREVVIEKYRQWLPKQKALMQALPTLRGKILGCHCKPLQCHADILVELANSG